MGTLPAPPARRFVELLKITGYLLNVRHPVSGAKAKFFLGWGFSPSRPDEFAAAIVAHADTVAMTSATIGRFGSTFVFRGPLAAPNGATPPVRSVWEVAPGEVEGRPVTAYPCVAGAAPLDTRSSRTAPDGG